MGPSKLHQYWLPTGSTNYCQNTKSLKPLLIFKSAQPCKTTFHFLEMTANPPISLPHRHILFHNKKILDKEETEPHSFETLIQRLTRTSGSRQRISRGVDSVEHLAPFTGGRGLWHLRSPTTNSLENLARTLPTATVFTTRSFSHFALAAISGRL